MNNSPEAIEDVDECGPRLVGDAVDHSDMVERAKGTQSNPAHERTHACVRL